MMAGFTIVLPSPIAGNKKPTVKVGFLRVIWSAREDLKS
jgi:hypothetical protein